jgi:hypothetical protein
MFDSFVAYIDVNAPILFARCGQHSTFWPALSISEKLLAIHHSKAKTKLKT